MTATASAIEAVPTNGSTAPPIPSPSTGRTPLGDGAGPPRPLRIQEVADLVGLSAHTLRYYERAGLLDVGRDAGGRRQYTGQDIARVVFITRLRAADLPISRIQHYFALVAAGPDTEPERLALLERHRDEVRARLASLQEALAAIEFKIATCGGSLTACTPPPTEL